MSMRLETAILLSIGNYNRMADLFEANIGQPFTWSDREGQPPLSVNGVKIFLGALNDPLCSFFPSRCLGCPFLLSPSTPGCGSSPHSLLQEYAYSGFSTVTEAEVKLAREEVTILKQFLKEVRDGVQF